MKPKITVKSTDHLKQLIKQEIALNGNECNLNHIDISKITGIDWIFYETEFNGDISKWNTSHITSMDGVFCLSKFDGDISNWNVEKVEEMDFIFFESLFNKDLSNWKPYIAKKISYAFPDNFPNIPYWVNYEDLSIRKKVIDAYHLEQELPQNNTKGKIIKI